MPKGFARMMESGSRIPQTRRSFDACSAVGFCESGMGPGVRGGAQHDGPVVRGMARGSP